jgi:hypothetical protein
MTLVISKGITLRKGWQPMDADAAAYITAVETADTEPLEEKTKIAIDNFVLGCKADGTWTAIKASCILAGARTLNGALVPLVGTAPTNVGGLFVSGDYNRKTGLVGDGSTKYLDSNRLDSDDPIANFHCSTYLTTAEPTGNVVMYMGLLGRLQHGSTGTSAFYASKRGGFSTATNSGKPVNFFGQQRSSLTSETARVNGNTYTANTTANANNSNPIFVFRFSQNAAPLYPSARLAFYSIGESLNLALLDARVTDLINAFGAAIP